MLKEQAISLLTQVKEIVLGSKSWLDSTHQPIEEAFSMAIEAIKSTQHNTPNTLNALDCISRRAAMEDISKQHTYKMFEGEDTLYLDANDVGSVLASLPSAQPESLSDAYMKAVWTWLLNYQIKAAELEGRYTPYEVLSWVANDWRKENEIN